MSKLGSCIGLKLALSAMLALSIGACSDGRLFPAKPSTSAAQSQDSSEAAKTYRSLAQSSAEPGTPEYYINYCKKMSKTEVEDFAEIVRSNDQIKKSQKHITTLVELLKIKKFLVPTIPVDETIEEEEIRKKKDWSNFNLELYSRVRCESKVTDPAIEAENEKIKRDNEKRRKKKPLKNSKKCEPGQLHKTFEASALESFLRIILSSCYYMRTEGTVGQHEIGKEAEKWIRRNCGPADEKFPQNKRRHGSEVRNWGPEDEDQPYTKRSPLNIRQQIMALNGLSNSNNEFSGTEDQLIESCVSFEKAQNIEDSVERLFVCMMAVLVKKIEKKPNGVFVLDENNLPKMRNFSEPVEKCIEGVAKDLVVLDRSGKPKPKEQKPKEPRVIDMDKRYGEKNDSKTPPNPDEPPPPLPTPTPSATPDPKAPKTKTATQNPPPQPNARVYSDNGENNGTGGWSDPNAKTGDKDQRKQEASSGNGKPQEPKFCMPGDGKDNEGECGKDSCLRDLAYRVHRTKLIPDTTTSKDVQDLVEEERWDFAYEMSLEQSRVMTDRYAIMAQQQKWDSPKAYNDNLTMFELATGAEELYKPIQGLMSGNRLPEQELGGTQSPLFYQYQQVAATKEVAMLEVAKQIESLRDLAGTLRYEHGFDSSHSTPMWWKQVPLLSYFAGAHIAIDLGTQAENFQCNLFELISPSWFVPATRGELLRPNDELIRKVMYNPEFRKRTFCTDTLGIHYKNTPEAEAPCHYPYEFSRYWTESDPKGLLDLPKRKDVLDKPDILAQIDKVPKTRIRDFCDVRARAANSIVGMEAMLVSLYPALGYHDDVEEDTLVKDFKKYYGKDYNRETPLVARILEKVHAGVPEADILKFIKTESDYALPKLQERMRKGLTKSGWDIRDKSMDGTYMGLIGQEFLGNFSYCETGSKGFGTRKGIPCKLREEYLTCVLTKEAKHWVEKSRVPQFLVDAFFTAFDAFGVGSLAKSVLKDGIKKFVTKTFWKEAWKSAVPGALIAAASWAVTRKFASYHNETWVGYNNAVAGSMMNGVDGYTNALATIAESQHDFNIAHVITGALYGAAFHSAKSKTRHDWLVPSKKKGGGQPHLDFAALELRKVSGEKLVEVAEKLEVKLKDALESDGKGGQRINKGKLKEIKNWLKEEIKSPEELADFERALRKGMAKLADNVWTGALKPKSGLTQLRYYLSAQLKAAASKLRQQIIDLKRSISKRRMKSEKLTPEEIEVAEMSPERIEEVAMDMSETADHADPQSLASLVDETEQVLENSADPKADAPPKKAGRFLGFLKKFGEVSGACKIGRGCRSLVKAIFSPITKPLKWVLERLQQAHKEKIAAQSEAIANHAKQWRAESVEWAKTQEAQDWAKENGHDLSDPQAAYKAYLEAKILKDLQETQAAHKKKKPSKQAKQDFYNKLWAWAHEMNPNVAENIKTAHEHGRLLREVYSVALRRWAKSLGKLTVAPELIRGLVVKPYQWLRGRKFLDVSKRDLSTPKGNALFYAELAKSVYLAAHPNGTLTRLWFSSFNLQDWPWIELSNKVDEILTQKYREYMEGAMQPWGDVGIEAVNDMHSFGAIDYGLRTLAGFVHGKNGFKGNVRAEAAVQKTAYKIAFFLWPAIVASAYFISDAAWDEVTNLWLEHEMNKAKPDLANEIKKQMQGSGTCQWDERIKQIEEDETEITRLRPIRETQKAELETRLGRGIASETEREQAIDQLGLINRELADFDRSMRHYGRVRKHVAETCDPNAKAGQVLDNYKQQMTR